LTAPCRFLNPILKFIDPVLAGTVGTTIKDTLSLHAVTDDPAAAMGTGWCQGMDGAFKTIEDMRLAIDPHFKALIVHVPAYFTSHIIPLLIHY
jgi:hypothetical protein